MIKHVLCSRLAGALPPHVVLLAYLAAFATALSGVAVCRVIQLAVKR
jgi:hypothetical protein